ncbi:response regulator [Halarcobacter ebronensis]|uniref:Response regulatory domain-containing protein n=1 Tax=Halarcobacter ebronensis TaxID=1462615 RepID=A0A4Q1AU49_9BACT|nr:response regulator [Halarcobacter ebronensis]QKF82211.1 PAS sensor-containing response regulator [Halarcobacter ebronensis]RXK03412.1 hypothetical protein CRV07_12080 [Halarcobacter ebronensis]
MSQLHECTFNKDYLSAATILFIENNEKIRSEATEIFTAFFRKVLVATDINDAINIFKANRMDIDIILTDIDMPDFGGIVLLAELRKIDWDIPVLISSNFSDPNILLKAIKFNLTNYIVKPIQLNTTLKIMSDIMLKKQQQKELAIKNNELRQFMSILDSYNIICELDLNFKITLANDSFLMNSGFELDELIGLHFNNKNIFRHSDVPDIKIKEILVNGKTWVGFSKKMTKAGEFYYTHSTILPIFFNDGRIKKFVEFSTLISKYENEIQSLRKHIFLLKSENLKNNSELRKEREHYYNIAHNLQSQMDENVNNAQKNLFEVYELKKQNAILRDKLKIQEKRFEEFQATIMSGR